MGVVVSIELDEALNKHVEAVMGENAFYPDIGAYVRDLIQSDLDRRRWEFDAVKAELQRAFATPKEDYVLVSAEDVMERNRHRLGG